MLISCCFKVFWCSSFFIKLPEVSVEDFLLLLRVRANFVYHSLRKMRANFGDWLSIHTFIWFLCNFLGSFVFLPDFPSHRIKVSKGFTFANQNGFDDPHRTTAGFEAIWSRTKWSWKSQALLSGSDWLTSGVKPCFIPEIHVDPSFHELFSPSSY